VAFTWQEVQAAAGKAPWDRWQEFASAISPEDMADTAVVYARAAEGARDSGSLARRATDLAEGSGEIDGSALVDADGRIDETSAALQNDGDGAWEVVGRLVQAMNLAIDTEREVTDVIDGPDGLNAKLQGHLDAAVAEYNRSAETAGSREDAANLAREIRARHLGAAADDATAAYGSITELIDGYVRRLADLGDELGRSGFEVTNASLPDGLWLSDAVARAAAEGLTAQLTAEDPNRDLIDRYAQVVARVTAAGDLSRAERDFLTAFYGHLDAKTLAALGTAPTGDGDGDPANGLVDTGLITAHTALADGIMLLTDPDRGGHDPAGEAGRNALPESVRHFVYDARYTDLPGSAPLPGGPSPAAEARQGLVGFAGLLANASLPPGQAFAEDLGRAALRANAWSGVEDFGGTSAPVFVPGWDESSRAAGTLLTIAAGNEEAAAVLLAEKDFSRDLLAQQWKDSAGPAALISAGTLPPEGVADDSDAAEPYREAGHRLLTEVADAGLHASILGDGSRGADHTALQQSILDTGVHYLSGRPGGETQRGLTELMYQAEPGVRQDYIDRFVVVVELPPSTTVEPAEPGQEEYYPRDPVQDNAWHEVLRNL
jgi:hypothetical protein